MSARLLDHFNPPLSTRRHWHAFHNAWATYLASDLNTKLPNGYFAEPNVQFGLEIDVAAFEERQGPPPSAQEVEAWTPPAPVMTLPFSAVQETAEVLVYNNAEGPVLAAAVELVSPANKDRPAHRDAFVSKCQTYLEWKAGLVIVDIVTTRGINLHNQLIARMGKAPAGPGSSDLYVSACRPVEQGEQTHLELWYEPLTLGADLPTVPLWLRGGRVVPLDLGATYRRTCTEQRIEP